MEDYTTIKDYTTHTTSEILLLAGIVFIINLVILFQIIKSASKSKKILMESRKQTLLLIEIAKTSDVQEETIKRIDDDDRIYRQLFDKEVHQTLTEQEKAAELKNP